MSPARGHRRFGRSSLLRAAGRIALLALTTWFAVAHAASAPAGYPRTVVDLAGRNVTLPRAPQRLYLQNGNHLMMLAILEREHPFQRLAAWNNTLRQSDPTLWSLFESRWPTESQVPQLRFDSSGDGDLEAIVWMNPDLLVLDLTSRPAVESGALGPLMRRLQVPILYVDTARDPVINTPRSVKLLGQVLNREDRADAYTNFYAGQLRRLRQAIGDAPRPTVFLEVRAGRLGLDQCCYSQNGTSWSRLVEAAGAHNYASDYLAGATGDIAMEMLIARPPHVYLMTGTQQMRDTSRAIPFGYGVSTQAVQTAMAQLMARTGFDRIAAGPQGCVIGISHQFYDNAFNVAGIGYLARQLYPDRLATLSPDDDYRAMVRRFTELPDRPFVMSASRRSDGAGSC